MLFEGLIYADNFPININVVNLVEDPLHYHLDIEFVYVLRGDIHLKNGCHEYTLHAEDIFINTGHEVHGLRAVSEDNVVAIIQISSHYFSHYFPDLSKSCYRTYSKRSNDKKLNRLRGLLLQVLLKYTMQDLNYKSECISLTVDIIKYLDKYFNLFAFDKDLVVSFDRGNLMAIERISRIYTYIYQYYADNITLNDISEMEHLSSYYLSHLIKSFTGLSFRELLCFARVEWSQLRLLETNSKISQIARDVGFSTTAYYEKYFLKWFKVTPKEHRAVTMPLIKSELRPATLNPLSQSQIIAVTKAAHANYNLKQGRPVTVVRNLETDVNLNRPPIFRFDRALTVKITVDDYKALGGGLLTELSALAPGKVAVLRREQDSQRELQKLYSLLYGSNFSVEKRNFEPEEQPCSFAYDSIAYPIHLIRNCLRAGQTPPPLDLFLRDSGSPENILQGQKAPLTAAGIRKPSFYAYQLLSNVKGNVLAQNNQCCVLQLCSGSPPTLVVLMYNTNEAIQNTCLKYAAFHQVQNALNDFKDEINISACINLKPGMYSVLKYSMDRENNIFAYMAALDFQNDAAARLLRPEYLPEALSLEVYREDVQTLFRFNSYIKGIGLQILVIKPIKGIR